MQTAFEAKRDRPAPVREPRPGSKTRAIYDTFKDHPGELVDFACKHKDGARMMALRDTYGLDIRNFGYRRWALVGEWFGSRYVDYLADAAKNADESTVSRGSSEISEDNRGPA